jgi:hypothetical protein
MGLGLALMESTIAASSGSFGAVVSGGALGGTNQLCWHLAQRTVRPAAPMAASGTA